MRRRSFLSTAFAPEPAGTLTDVPGVKVGHFTDRRRPTGCTVLLFERGATAGVDVRGSAPGTRETDLLDPVNTVQQIHGLLLTGGSAYGLDAAAGVMRFLEEKKIGYPVPTGVVPIVPAAVIFDLGVGGQPRIRPDAEAGYQAAKAASGGPVSEGNVGAGAGATIGKFYGLARAMKGGLGTASRRLGASGLVVGAVVAVNAFGDIFENGQLVAGARTADGRALAGARDRILAGEGAVRPAGTNTTIGAIVTNAALDKAQAKKIAQMAHDGLARVIDPVHTPADGDTIFAAATGTAPQARAEVGVLGAIAAHVLAEAVLRAVRRATSLPGLPAVRDWRR